MHGDQSEPVTWRDGVPISPRFDDPYYSLEDGLAETAHVFLEGNDLPHRLCPGFHIAELGIGTGLNLLALADLAQRLDRPGIRYTGFEAYPLPADDLGQALDAFPSLATLAAPLLTAWRSGATRAQIGPVLAEFRIGDARRTLPAWEGRADAWFLDGFAPAKNPELWEPGLLALVAAHTAPGGSFATYTAAGAVRRALGEAGFTVERVPGYGRKRHMSRGRLDP